MSTILIVDADAKSRDILGQVLSSGQYHLVFAETGKQGLQKAAETPPDLVILDARLPDIDGCEACRHLRLDPLLADMPIIMVAGQGDRDCRLRGIEAGADDVLFRPFDSGELRALVKTITKLNRYRSRLDERTSYQRERVGSDQAHEAALDVWARALELRGVEPAGHIRRILPMTMRLARELGLPDKELRRLRTGVLLHDIGLMGIPDAILLQSRPLTAREQALLRMHTVHAHNLLSPVAALQPSLDIPYGHHENWDGSGFPRGLKGTEIPLLARIFAVVDAWDELGADRPRDKAWPPERVLAHIRAHAGTRFDPQIVQAFERILQVERTPVALPPRPTTGGDGADAEMPGRPVRVWRRGLSLVSQGTRVHFIIATALISILPLMALSYFTFSGVLPVAYRLTVLVASGGVVLAMMALGYALLAKYPRNIGRLRQQLEALAKGMLPLRVDLDQDEDDLVAIGESMRNVVRQAGERIRMIEQQTESLLVAERQRVAIEGLGAACHHLGGPATAMRMALYLARNAVTAEEREGLLVQCEESSDAIADTLKKLQHIANYRTEPYLPAAGGARAPKSGDILEI